MLRLARTMDATSHRWSALTAALVACLALCGLSGLAISASFQRELTLQLKPLKTIVKQDEAIGMMVVFVGGAQETTLVLPAGADASGIITYQAVEIASGREWAASYRDPRSFAVDARRSIPAGGKLEQHHHALDFKGPGVVLGNPPAGRYRIVVIYDERNTFRPENRTSRVLRSKPVEIVVTAR